MFGSARLPKLASATSSSRAWVTGRRNRQCGRCSLSSDFDDVCHCEGKCAERGTSSRNGCRRSCRHRPLLWHSHSTQWQRLEDSRNALVVSSGDIQVGDRGRSKETLRTLACRRFSSSLAARRCTFEHCTSCFPSRDVTMVALTKKKTPNTAYHSTKKIFWGSVPTSEARCSLKSAVWRRIEWVHQSANDKTTTWPPSCRLSLKKLLRPAWPRAERGHHSAVRGLPMNFRDLSWWPPLFFPTQNG